MCIAVPMTVTETRANEALCVRPGRSVWADTSFTDKVVPGDRVLVFRDEILRKIDTAEAQKIEAALTCVDAAMSGTVSDVDAAFADILENTGKLPPHLAAQVKI